MESREYEASSADRRRKSQHLECRPIARGDSYQVVSVLNGIGDALDGCLKFILVAPILVDHARSGIGRPIKSLFDVVVPNHCPSNDGDNPEAASLVPIRALLPLNRLDFDPVP